MRYVTLEPYITDLLLFFGEQRNIVAVSHHSVMPEDGEAISVTKPLAQGGSEGVASPNLYHDPRLSRELIDLAALRSVAPDTIIADLVHPIPGEEYTSGEVKAIEQDLIVKLGQPLRLLSYSPRRLEEIFEDGDRLAKELKVTDRGSSIGRRAKAQLMDWGDNFYDRMKNKKVSFIVSIEPFRLGGLWLPDMIKTLSAVSQVKAPAYEHPFSSWEDVVQFRPDVIMVSLIGSSLEENMQAFKILEKYPSWEDLPAVKRGEVVFCDGVDHFFSPGPKIIDSFGIMVSAIAGFESGYITKRDSFYRLRWLELQRHRI